MNEINLYIKKSIVYCIKNAITNKIYIGKTIKSFGKRYSGCKWWIKTDNDLLKIDAEKYGIQNFEVSIIEWNIPKLDIENRENFYIDKYNSIHPNGYNKCKSGKIGQISEYTKSKQSNIKKEYYKTHKSHLLGKKMSEKTKKIISIQKRGKKWNIRQRIGRQKSQLKGKDHPMYGRSIKGFLHSNETKLKMSNSKKNSIVKCNPVFQIDPSTKNIIKEFFSIISAAKELNTSTDNIYNAINHKKNQKTAAGFEWRYKNSSQKYSKILQIDICSGNIINEYNSHSEAAKFIGIKGKSNIISVCKGRRLSCGGFKWAFK